MGPKRRIPTKTWQSDPSLPRELSARPRPVVYSNSVEKHLILSRASYKLSLWAFKHRIPSNHVKCYYWVKSKASSRHSKPSNGMSANWIFIAPRLINSRTDTCYRNQKPIERNARLMHLIKWLWVDNLGRKRRCGLLLCHRACKRSLCPQSNFKWCTKLTRVKIISSSDCDVQNQRKSNRKRLR